MFALYGRVAQQSTAKAIFLLLLPSLLLFSRGLADGTVVLTGFIFLWHSYRHQEWQWLQQPWFRWSLVLLAYLVLVCAPLSYRTSDSLLYSLAYIRWPLFAMALACLCFRSKDDLRLLGLGLAIPLGFIVFDCFWQLFLGTDIFGYEKFDGFRLTGPLRNPLPGNLTVRLFFITAFSLVLFQWCRSEKHLFSLLLPLVLVLVVFVYATGERMMFIFSLAGSAILLLGLTAEYPKYKTLMMLWGSGVVVFLLAFSLLVPSLYERSVLSVFSAVGDFGNHDYYRVFTSGVKIWLDNPIVGVGLGVYAEYCDDFVRVVEINACQRHPHNLYLHWLATTGVVGCILFIVSFICLARQIIGRIKAEKNWLLLSCVVATMFVSFWPIATASSSFFNNWVGAIIWCGLAWCLAVSRLASELRVAKLCSGQELGSAELDK